MSTTQSGQTQTPQQRHREIQQAVEGLSTPRVTTDNSELLWFFPSRESQDYHRLAAMDEDIDEPFIDVYLDKTVKRRNGVIQIEASVVLYPARGQYTVAEEDIFAWTFDGYDQPREQAFLLNVPTYQQQINDAVERFVETAELRGQEMIAEADTEAEQ